MRMTFGARSTRQSSVPDRSDDRDPAVDTATTPETGDDPTVEGIMDIVARSVLGAVFHEVPDCTGPDGSLRTQYWLALPDGTALLELEPTPCSATDGPDAPAAQDPTALPALGRLRSTTRGAGQVVLAALDAGCTGVTIVVGSPSAADASTGALCALGLRLLDSGGEALGPGGAELARLELADMSDLRRPPAGGVTLLTDSTRPLLGARGAVAVARRAPGVSAEGAATLSSGLERLVGVLGGTPDAPGSGAAGGAVYGLMVGMGARVESPSSYLARVLGPSVAAEQVDVQP